MRNNFGVIHPHNIFFGKSEKITFFMAHYKEFFLISFVRKSYFILEKHSKM